jgi:hypothetical protein
MPTVAATLDTARGAIWSKLATALSASLLHAPEHPIGNAPQYPAMAVRVDGGVWTPEFGATVMLGLVRVAVDIHVSRKAGDAAAMDELQPFMESVPNALVLALGTDGFTYGGNTIRFTFGSIEFEVGTSKWGTDDTMIARFTVTDVKVRNTVA